MHTEETTEEGRMSVSMEALQELWASQGHSREQEAVVGKNMGPLAERLARVQGWGGDYARVDFSEEIKSDASVRS